MYCIWGNSIKNTVLVAPFSCVLLFGSRRLEFPSLQCLGTLLQSFPCIANSSLVIAILVGLILESVGVIIFECFDCVIDIKIVVPNCGFLLKKVVKVYIFYINFVGAWTFGIILWCTIKICELYIILFNLEVRMLEVEQEISLKKLLNRSDRGSRGLTSFVYAKCRKMFRR